MRWKGGGCIRQDSRNSKENPSLGRKIFRHHPAYSGVFSPSVGAGAAGSLALPLSDIDCSSD